MNINYSIAVAKALLFLRPNHPSSHTILAKAFAKGKFPERALECWTEARNRFPQQDKIIRGRIRTLKALKRYDEAIIEAKHLVALRPDDPSGYVYHAKVLMSQERFDLALERWTEARSRFPEDRDVIHGQIRTLQELGRFEEGLIDAEHLIDLDPKQPLGHFCVADLLMSQGRFAEALEKWTQVGGMFRDPERISQGKIRALRELGKLDEALIEADRLIAERPMDPDCYAVRFDVLYLTSHYRDSYIYISEQIRQQKPSLAILNRFISAAIALKGKKFARRFCYHMLCAHPQESSILLIRYLFLSADTGYTTGINTAISAFPQFRPAVNDKINLIMAICYANNLDMYKSLELFTKHSCAKNNLYAISQIIVMSAVLGDRILARKGLIDLQKYQEIYRGNENQPIYSNTRMHLRFNIIDDEIETLMASLAPLMKDEQYDQVFRTASDYVGEHKKETSLCCVYLIAAIKSGAYKFQPSDSAPEPRMMFYWDSVKIPHQIDDLIAINKNNNPDLECHVHNDESAKAFLKEHFDSYVLEAYSNAIHPSQKGDIFRLAFLYHMGGYYIDVDDLVLVGLRRHFAGAASAYFLESIGHLGNNFLATMAGNRVFEGMLIEACENVSRGEFDGCIWRGTGPGLVSRHVARQVNDIIQNGLAQNVRIAIPKEHKRISSYHLPLNYKKAGFHWMDGEETG